MKINALTRNCIIASILASGLACSKASVITGIGDNIIGPSVVAPGDADNYVYFGRVDASTDFDFSFSSGALAYPGDPSYTTSTAPDGTSISPTGILYNGSVTPSTSAILYTFDTTLSDFDVYLMTDNIGAGLSYNNLSVTLSDGVSTATLIPASANGVNDYLHFSVRGASPTDTFTVSAVAGAAGFSSVAAMTLQSVPEPSSWALLFGGLLTLAFVRRRSVSRI